MSPLSPGCIKVVLEGAALICWLGPGGANAPAACACPQLALPQSSLPGAGLTVRCVDGTLRLGHRSPLIPGQSELPQAGPPTVGQPPQAAGLPPPSASLGAALASAAACSMRPCRVRVALEEPSAHASGIVLIKVGNRWGFHLWCFPKSRRQAAITKGCFHC